MTQATERPEVAILLALHNGGRFLPTQLASIARQRGVDWRLTVSDDGSTDAGPESLRAFAATRPHRRIELMAGPGQGAAANFLRLLHAVPEDTAFAAFCDQDDAWLPGKLARATAHLAVQSPWRPALYCGRTIVCDEALRPLGLSPLFSRPPSFPNALAQSIAGGNTMVLNRAALRLARSAAGEAGAVVMHDWWLYQLITGAGGTVIYDPVPQVLYRQHGTNAVGANGGWPARLSRALRVGQGVLRDWNGTNIAALRASAHRLTPANRVLLETFAQARQAPFAARMRGLARAGLHRQTRGGNASYWCAAAAGLI